MKIPICQIDAFAEKVFSGNPAAVCPLNEWLSDEIMQNIAMENNLAETAFIVKNNDFYEIRWFTPTVEVDLCGHATLASAFVIFNYENHSGDMVNFYSHRSGKLSVCKNNDFLTLNFPIDTIEQIELTEEIYECFNIKPKLAFKGKTDYLLIFNNEDEIVDLIPNFINISKINARGIIVSAQGKNTDFVSRFFGPKVGINEDPVTGSAHTTLIPYWSNQLNKNLLSALQLSNRRGFLRCELKDGRVEISGKCKLFLKGEIYLD